MAFCKETEENFLGKLRASSLCQKGRRCHLLSSKDKTSTSEKGAFVLKDLLYAFGANLDGGKPCMSQQTHTEKLTARMGQTQRSCCTLAALVAHQD